MALETNNDGARRLVRAAFLALTLGIAALCGCVSCASGSGGASSSATSSGTADTTSTAASSASNNGSSSAESASADASAVNSSASASGEAAPDKALLVSIMGEEDAAKLLKGVDDNADRYWIAAHPQELAIDGEAVQEKLLRLAAEEDDALKYVRDFPQRYAYGANASEGGFGHAKVQADSAVIADKNDSSAASIDDSGYPTVKTGNANVPHLYQWDQRWGYAVYSSSAFGLTGCGPTAMAIAYQGVTGKTDIDPFDMGKLAYDMGFMAQFEGTDGTFLEMIAPQLGMECEYIDFSEEGLRDAFNRGLVVIDNMGDGYFSHYGGHYLVLTGLDDQGKIVMNDPYSAVNSRKTWDVDFILGETRALYAFSKAKGNADSDSSKSASSASSGIGGQASGADGADDSQNAPAESLGDTDVDSDNGSGSDIEAEPEE